MRRAVECRELAPPDVLDDLAAPQFELWPVRLGLMDGGGNVAPAKQLEGPDAVRAGHQPKFVAALQKLHRVLQTRRLDGGRQALGPVLVDRPQAVADLDFGDGKRSGAIGRR